MFTKKDVDADDLRKAESEAVASVIDKSMVITGEIFFQGKTKIDGAITGNVSGEHLIVSSSGKITGDVKVTSFSCFGTLRGNVEAGIVIARKDCAIHGKIVAGSLTVEPGAVLDGEIKAALNKGTSTPLTSLPEATVLPAKKE
ncbi:MAG: polymer-forming cytoskeletal protein [Desulfobulbaceae bacterium]|jgi:cytoskeletal protein CcmA (bactofilin family)|nr:polymer-forming cytoskeletal protein [Desulfobulbaceae bacterium]